MSSNTHCEADMNHCNSGFLDMECAPKRYAFRGTQQFWDIWEMQWKAQDSEWVLFTDVDEETFTRDFLNSPDKIIRKSWNSYDKTNQLLLTKMPISSEHGAAASGFEARMTLALAHMGLESKVTGSGSAGHRGYDGGKQPDCQWRPTRPPPGRSKEWPTVVVEVAVSESASKAMSDVRWWLRQGDGDVQIVVILRVDRQGPKITLEKWGRGSNEQPHRHSSVVVYKNSNQPIKVDDGPLVIEFEKLFLRAPDCPKEKDIILGDEELKGLAKRIWNAQGFYDEE
ncbi:hypothetical protein DTO164E3_8356 [Paecilomyces variotii]|nr:hypothetical protein DTO164E3_8356 [Paecilomyces variotii]KAJ9207499.1 hypothetical protein DTO032I3_1143 [Paecilomyces variotii]KAJ9245176.1 hypothetical protein DTO169E5_1043 [Paecilomyces variotii]KAJ9274150.1 hypothetical protein DTO021D3_8988 [Paecilomyces variotii]KAJ9286917.1 hypothetical protein DTO021C3_5437 [Paecilomyces variotii]